MNLGVDRLYPHHTSFDIRTVLKSLVLELDLDHLTRVNFLEIIIVEFFSASRLVKTCTDCDTSSRQILFMHHPVRSSGAKAGKRWVAEDCTDNQAVMDRGFGKCETGLEATYGDRDLDYDSKGFPYALAIIDATMTTEYVRAVPCGSCKALTLILPSTK